MLKIYGSLLCPECVQCRKDLDRAGISYEYLDFAEDLHNLKELPVLREQPALNRIREAGGIGIPCILTEDGTVHLEWEDLM